MLSLGHSRHRIFTIINFWYIVADKAKIFADHLIFSNLAQDHLVNNLTRSSVTRFSFKSWLNDTIILIVMHLPKVNVAAFECQVDIGIEDENIENVAEDVYLLHYFNAFLTELGKCEQVTCVVEQV